MANNKKTNKKKISKKLTEEQVSALLAKLPAYKMEYEDNATDFHLSPSFGKKPPLVIRMLITAHHAVINFIFDITVATKAILKEIL